LSTCPQCGQENKDEARFCIKCGASLPPAAQAPSPPPEAGAATTAAAGTMSPPPAEVAPPPAAAPPVPPQAASTLGQPAAPAQPPPAQPYTPPAQPAQPIYQQPPAQTPYAAPPGVGYAPAPAYGAPAKTRSVAFWIGACIVVIAGIMVLTCTFMPWVKGPLGYGSINGWDTKDLTNNAFFDYGDGYPLFTGLTSLILGGLIALMGVLVLLLRSKGLASLAIIFSIIALGIAITNLTSILRDPIGIGLGAGVGIYIFIVFALAGLVGGGMAASG
jgi:hypothetical protein